jgi:hypothetical protein
MKSERDGINPAAKPSGTGCVECSAVGGWWLHLRRCVECGHVGCCDTSPNQHASKRNAAAGHPIITSFEPASDGSTTIVLESSSPARSFMPLTRICWINRCPDQPKRCLQTGKRCFTNRGRLFGVDVCYCEGLTSLWANVFSEASVALNRRSCVKAIIQAVVWRA